MIRPASTAADPEEDSLHVCDLDSFIEALQALRDSDADRQNRARWEL